jgi:hypothetical protein
MYNISYYVTDYIIILYVFQERKSEINWDLLKPNYCYKLGYIDHGYKRRKFVSYFSLEWSLYYKNVHGYNEVTIINFGWPLDIRYNRL